MYTESEIREDMSKLCDHIDTLIDKYGEDFSCIISAGVDMDDAWAGSCMSYGENYLLHQACHGLLNNPKFIDEFFDAVKCIILKQGEDRPEFLKKMVTESIESMKRMLIKETEPYKKYKAEKEVDEAVQDLLKQAGFAN